MPSDFIDTGVSLPALQTLSQKSTDKNDDRSFLSRGSTCRGRQKTLQNPWLFQLKARLISSYLSRLGLTEGHVGCSLRVALVNKTWFWLWAPWTLLGGLGLGPTAAVWKNSCRQGMQWEVPVWRLKGWVCVCAIVNCISSAFIAATDSDDG